MFLKSHTLLHLKPAALLLALFIGLGPLSAQAEDKLTLNFADTDINAVINAVAKLTGKNFIIDPRVKGKVTVITHEAMSKDEVYLVFLSLLKVHGFAAVPGKNTIKIVPEANAKQDSIKTVERARFSSGDELITQVIHIKYVDASKLVPILRPLIPQRGHLAAYPQSNILIISDSSANVARLTQIIARIDQSVNEDIEVMTLEHANASDVVQTIKQLKSAKAKAKDVNYTLVPDDRTNSILISGDKHARVRLRALISHLDIPLEMGGDTHVIYLKYAKATELVKVLTGVSKTLTKGKGGKGAKAAASASSSSLNIQADESNNALVINAPQGILRSLRNVVRQLDLRRAQVLVEAVIAEVSYERSAELGIQWGADGTKGGNDTAPVGLVNLGKFGSSITGLTEEPPVAGEGLSLGMGTFTDSIIDGVLLRALAGDAETNILSTPNIVTMDNQEASIVVGQNVPFITGSYSNTGSGDSSSNPFQTIERQDVGLTLKIKPLINEGDTINLDIEVESSSLSSSTVGSDLITNKRTIKTSVMVEDDQVLVLGGLMEDSMREADEKVPGLGDIPIIGWLFKYKQMNKVKTNLMAFIHPTILKDQTITSKETGKKYNFIRDKQLAAKERGADLFSDDEIPVMSEFEPVPALPPRYQPVDADTRHDAPPEAL